MSKKINEKRNFIDEVFDFPGLWDMPSKCGLKIVRKLRQTIVIVTDLYDENPGTSVTSYCAELATYIVGKKDLPMQEIRFIQHNPDVGSKYEFLNETFDEVSFEITPNAFSNPQWKRVDRAYVEALIK